MEQELNKEYKITRSLVRLGSRVNQPVPSIETGLITLDKEVFGCGGAPRGRIIELIGPESSGKTTLALTIVAEAQKAGGIAAYVDAEHALDVTYASQFGVDVDNLLVSQPDYGEQALGIVEALVESGHVSVVVVDSVAALVPKAELDGEMGQSHMGLQARMMSQACRKLVGVAEKTGTTLVFINQIRMKIGVMYGCFQYNTRVTLADGTVEKIGKIVNQRLPVEVRSYNPVTGTIQRKKVVGWHRNGNTDKFLQMTIEKVGGNGVSQFAVTPNHMIFAPHGVVEAGSLKEGDYVLAQAKDILNATQRQIALGSVMGDGSLRQTGNNTVQLRIGHGPKQEEYCAFKQVCFGDNVSWSGRHSGGGWQFEVRPSTDLLDIWREAYWIDGERRLSPKLLSELTPMGVAIWYMDDGTFSGSYTKWGHGKAEISVKSYTLDERQAMADWLEDNGYGRPTVTKNGSLSWSGKECARFQKKISNYIYPSMQYKLHPRLRDKYEYVMQLYQNTAKSPASRAVPVRVLKITDKPKTKSMMKFDLTVEDNESYLVDGVAVHNSPETTTGGQALKFYSSVRLDIRRREPIKEGDHEIGHKMEVKAIKNKVGTPKKSTVLELYYPGESDITGFDRLGDLVTYGVHECVIEQKGAWFYYKGEKLGQGLDNAKETLRNNGALEAELRQAIKEKK